MITATDRKTISSKDPILLDGATGSQLQEYFANTWDLNELLFSSIKSAETYLQSPDPLRNPLIFYWGHTAVFYINKLKMAGLIENGINANYEKLFAIGVDPDCPENLDNSQIWPTLEDLGEYRKKVFETVKQVIDEFPTGEEINQRSPWWSLLMGLEHERIHFETSSVLFRQLRPELLECPALWNYAPTLGNPPENKLIEVKGGLVTIGKPEDDNIFGWDNEYGHLEKQVSPFIASQNLISNAEFMDFVRDEGYKRKVFWTEEGWNWVQKEKAEHPKFWVKDNNSFQYRTVFENLPMPFDFPVEINAHEAWAFCRWKGKGWRLLKEAEFVLLAKEDLLKKGEPAFSDQFNLNLKYGSPSPVGFLNRDQNKEGFNDLFGNVWDWLSDDFYSLPGFRVHPLYEDFSEPYFDSFHNMLLGGAWATTGTGASSKYRLWFRRNFFQHAGFRIAKSL